MNRAETSEPANVNFHFDPLCPYAWRTALWIREARNVRPINVHWRLFSLEIVNRKEGVEPDYINGYGWVALRSLAYAHRKYGNEGIEKLYIALGNAQHGDRKESIRDRAVVEHCVQEAGFEPDFVAAALADDSTTQDVLRDHEEAASRYNAFGVPTIAFENSNVGFYGPVVIDVPHGEEAGELWDHTAWLLRQPNVFELKRDRAQVELRPVSA